MADLGDNMADAVLLELLREGALLLYVLALAVAECLVDIGGTARADQVDLLEIDALSLSEILSLRHSVRLGGL